MWKVTINGMLAHKLRLALTALAIVLGVTFITGTFVLTDTLHNTFTTLFSSVYQNIDFQVRGVAQFSNNAGAGAVRNPIPESLLRTIRRIPEVEIAEGSVEGYAQYVSHGGTAISSGGAPTLGLSFDPYPQMSALHLTQGAAPSTADEVVMDAGTATKHHFRVGERVRILLSGPPKTFTISGIAHALYNPPGSSSNGQPEVNMVMCTSVPWVRWNFAQRLGPYMCPAERNWSL